MKKSSLIMVFGVLLLMLSSALRPVYGSNYEIDLAKNEDCVLEVISIDEAGLTEVFGKRYYKECKFLENSWKSKFQLKKVYEDTQPIKLKIDYWGWRVQDFGETLPNTLNWSLSLDPRNMTVPYFWVFPKELLKIYYFVPTPTEEFLEELSDSLGEDYSSEDNVLIYNLISLEDKAYVVESKYDTQTGLLLNMKMKDEMGKILVEIDSEALSIPGFEFPLLIGVLCISTTCVIIYIFILKRLKG